MFTFTAPIRKIWVMRCVDVPAKIYRALGGAASIPVIARYAGESTETSVTSGGGGLGRLTLRMDVLRPARLDAGDRVEISLEPDTASREPEIPADFAAALRFRAAAAEEFARAPVGMRRQIMLYLAKAKSEDTRAGRIERIIESLAKKKKMTNDE